MSWLSIRPRLNYHSVARPNGPNSCHDSKPAVGLIAVCSCAVLVLAACASTSSPSTKTPAASASGIPTGTLTIATAEPPASFDPVQADNSTVDQMDINMYSTLVQYPSGQNPTLQPSLATSWQLTNHGSTYVFHLRSGVKFHNGAPLTANDVVFTLDRIKTLNIGMASELSAFKSASATGPLTVTVNLTGPYFAFLGALSHVYILNAALVEQHLGSDDGQTWLGTHDAGSGPYELSQYTPGASVTFVAFKDYWGGWRGHHVATVVYNFLANSSTQQEALDSGTANIAMNINKQALPSFLHKPGYSVNVAATLEEYYIFFDTQRGPTANPLVREALAYAYNYKVHLASILDGYGKPVDGPMPNGMACHANVPQPTFDLAKAKALLAQAGYTHLTLAMEYLPVLQEEAESFLLYKSDLAKIGVTLTPIPTTFPAYVRMLSNPATVPALAGVYAFPLDPNPTEIMNVNFDSRFIGSNGYNYAQYVNPTVDRLIRAAAAAPTVAAACPDYARAQQIIAADYVGAYISNPDYTTVLGPGVHGYSYNVAHTQTENTYGIWLSN